MEEGEKLNFLLRSLMSKVEGMESVGLFGREGIVVSLISDEDLSDDYLGDMCAKILATSEYLSMEIKEELDFVFLKSEEGGYLIMQCGYDYFLGSIVLDDVRMDLTLLYMKKTVNRILDLLEY